MTNLFFLRGLVSTARKCLLAVLRKQFTPVVERTVSNTQIACDLTHRLPAGLYELYRFDLKFPCIRSLCLLHDPCPFRVGFTLPSLLPSLLRVKTSPPLCVLSVGLFVASIQSYFASLHLLCTGTATACNAGGQLALSDVRRLQELGLSRDFFATYTIVLTSMLALGYWLVAAFLFWRKSDNRLALFAAVSLGTFPIAINDDFISTLSSPWWFPAHFISFLGSVCIILFFYVFPGGHFVPRWTGWVLVPLLAYWGFTEFFPVAPFNPFFPFPVLHVVTVLGVVGSTVCLQVYRYQRVSTPTQRQQTKWVVYGVTMGVGGFLLLISFGRFYPSLFPVGWLANLIATAAGIGLMLLLPLSIGFAVLRSRLWEITNIINRTLAYGSLTD